jgi:hypothetical protein
MSVVNLATLHVSVAYGLVREAWVVEGVAAEVLDIVAEVAAAVQDIEGAQAMAEGNLLMTPIHHMHSSSSFSKGWETPPRNPKTSKNETKFRRQLILYNQGSIQ